MGAAVNWFLLFAQSPGFAGVLAVVAAVIAFAASARNAKRERWWKRAEYAMNLTLSADESVQLAGLEMLDSLKSRDPREQEFISAATHWFLNAAARGAEPLRELHGAASPKRRPLPSFLTRVLRALRRE